MTTPPIIIIAEPDAMISGMLRVEFSRWDFAVLLATSCEQAGIYAAQTVAALVVLDAAKARMSAYETCVRIRHRPGYAARPIVLTEWEISARTQAAATIAGATALLAKPYSVMELFRAIMPYMQADDPLLVAGHVQTGLAAPPMQEWRGPGTLEWNSGADSALSRNRLLLPIVRGTGTKIPFGGKIS
jgi:DNA-binding response OmpR family regulator